MSLRVRILIVLLSVTILPMTATISVSLWRARAELVRLGQAQLQLAAKETGSNVQGWLSRTENIARLHARNKGYEDYYAGGASGVLLKRLQEDYLFTQESWLIAPNGRVYAVYAAPGVEPKVEIGDSVEDRPEFELPQISHATVLIDLNAESITYASYLPKADGSQGGVLVEVYYTKELQEILQHAVGAVGQNSFPLLLDADGEVILAGLSETQGNFLMQTVILETKGYQITFVQSESDFMGPVKVQIVTSLFLSGVSVCMVLLSGWFAAGYLVKPVNRLIGSIKGFGETGRLSQVEEGGDDEIGDLLRQFNRLARRAVTADELESRNRMLEATVYSLFHDIRGGIDDARFGIDLLGELVSPEQVEELGLGDVVSLIQQGVSRQEMIVSGLSQWLKSADTSGEKEPADIAEVIKVLQANTPYEGEIITRDLPVISINKDAFGIALDNLIRNAFKYNSSPSPKVEIYGEAGRLVIKDNGDGFDDSQFDRLTQPFQRSSTKGDSSGLGLAITRAIIESHGFTLRAESEVGVGSKFYIGYSFSADE